MNTLKREGRATALVMWRKAFSDWLNYRTDEAVIKEHAARQHYLLLAS